MTWRRLRRAEDFTACMLAYLAAFLKEYPGYLGDVSWCAECCSGDFDSLGGGLCWDRTDAHAGTVACCASWTALAASRS